MTPGGPLHGGWVRARLDDRGCTPVEGLLCLRDMPGQRWVAVEVLRAYHHPERVDPDSVEPLPEPLDIVPASELQSRLPAPGLVASLAEARARGLLPVAEPPRGGSWDDMHGRLDRAVQSLLDAGWAVEGRWHEESWEFGDSVSLDLRRGDRRYTAELYEDDALAFWLIDPEDEGDGDVEEDPEVEWIDGGAPDERLRRSYEDLGLLP